MALQSTILVSPRPIERTLTRREISSTTPKRDSLIDIMNVDRASLANVRACREIAGTTSKCAPRPQLPHYITIPAPIRSSKRSIESHYRGDHLQPFISCKTHGGETGSTNPIISLGNPNPLYLYGSCHVMSMQCKVLIDKHFVWILPCKIRVNDGQDQTH